MYPSMHCRRYPSMPCSRSPRGVCLVWGVPGRGVPGRGIPGQGPSGLVAFWFKVAFWFGAFWFGCNLVWWHPDLRRPSGMVLWCWGGGVQTAITEGHHTRRPPHQKALQEGHNRRPHSTRRPPSIRRPLNQKAIPEGHNRRPQQKAMTEPLQAHTQGGN